MATDLPTFVIGVFTALGTIGAVMGALYIANRQRADALQAQYDTLRPIIVPEQPVMNRVRAFSDGGPIDLPMYGNFDFNLSTSNLRIKNIGAGVATDVRGIIVGSEPPEPESTLPDHHSVDVAAPIPAGESLDPLTHRSPFLLRGSVQVVPNIKLYAPQEPTADDIERGASRIEYRLTLTYGDIFGNTHAAIYDFTAAKRWRTVRIERSVTKGLETLDHDARADGIIPQKAHSSANRRPLPWLWGRRRR